MIRYCLSIQKVTNVSSEILSLNEAGTDHINQFYEKFYSYVFDRMFIHQKFELWTRLVFFVNIQQRIHN